jgi:hypothetical protein
LILLERHAPSSRAPVSMSKSISASGRMTDHAPTPSKASPARPYVPRGVPRALRCDCGRFVLLRAKLTAAFLHLLNICLLNRSITHLVDLVRRHTRITCSLSTASRSLDASRLASQMVPASELAQNERKNTACSSETMCRKRMENTTYISSRRHGLLVGLLRSCKREREISPR